jgi:DNA repair protein RadA/Sms
VKNRFGPVDEVGCFDLSGEGIVPVTDPSALFISRHHEPVPGTCVTVSLEGKRPLLTEIQALVTASALERPRRTTSGIDSARANMLVAVLQQRGRLALAGRDVFVATVGGARVSEPGADLAIALAMASSFSDVAIPNDLVAIGEIGLAGELRRVRDMPRRLTEAARLGFGMAIVPSESGGPAKPAREVDGMIVSEAATIADALRVVTLAQDLQRLG